MKEGLHGDLAEFFGAFKGWFFLLSLLVLATAFVFDMILTLNSEKYSKRRAWYFAVLGGLLLFECGVEIFAARGNFYGEVVAFPLTLSGVGILLYTPLFFVSPDKKEDKYGKDISLDSEAVREINSFKPPEILTAKPPQNIAPPREIEFSHVKSVIDKLGGYPLSPAEKKTVNDLRYAVSAAEKGENPELYRERINDGLNAVLKIMSRYGV